MLLQMLVQTIGILLPVFALYILAAKAQTKTAMHLAIATMACIMLNSAHLVTLYSKNIVAVQLGFRLEYFGSTVFLLFFTLFFLRYLRVRKTVSIIKPWVFFSIVYSLFLLSDKLSVYCLSDFHMQPASAELRVITYVWYMLMVVCLLASFTFMSRRLKVTVAKIEIANQKRIRRAVTIIIVALVVSLLSKGRVDAIPIGSSLAVLIVTHGVIKGEILGIIESGRDWILENMNNAFILVDTEYGYLDSNQYATELFPELANLSRNRSVGKDVLSVIHGKEIYYDLNSSYYEKRMKPLVDGNNTVGYAILLVDVTQQIQAMSELTILKGLAEDLSQEKSNLLSNMSHEIRTPMNAIVGLTELLMRSQWPAKEMSYLQSIKNSGNGLLTVINDILDISKIDSGKFQLLEDNYELSSVLNDLSVTFLNRIGDRPVQLLYDIDPKLPAVLYGDVNRLRQILINILGNAVKFTESGYIKLSLEVKKIDEESINILISVKDTGVGIPSKDMPNLFKMFQQVDSKRNRGKEGTGLGLAISKSLVELMGGNISVESEYGKGSTFSFNVIQKVVSSKPLASIEQTDIVVGGYFSDSLLYANLRSLVSRYKLHWWNRTGNNGRSPDFFFTDAKAIEENDWISELVECDIPVYIMNNPMVSANIDQRYHSASLPLYSCNFCRILNREGETSVGASEAITFTAPDAYVLIVDDNDMNLKVACGLLEPLNMHVHCVESGAKAIEYVKRNTYDIIFMDHMMPEMDGVEATMVLRDMGITAPIIALTANVVDKARELYKKATMNDFLAKPFSMAEMCSMLLKWLPPEKCVSGKVNLATESAKDERLLNLSDEVDIYAGIKNAGSEKLLASLMQDFYCMIDSKLQEITEFFEEGNLQRFTIEVHAMKSAARLIGALDLSDKFRRLEESGKAGDMVALRHATPKVLKQYSDMKSILKEFAPVVEAHEVSAEEKINTLNTLKSALDVFDLESADSSVSQLRSFIWEDSIAGDIEKLYPLVSDVNTDVALPIIDYVLSKLEG